MRKTSEFIDSDIINGIFEFKIMKNKFDVSTKMNKKIFQTNLERIEKILNNFTEAIQIDFVPTDFPSAVSCSISSSKTIACSYLSSSDSIRYPNSNQLDLFFFSFNENISFFFFKLMFVLTLVENKNGMFSLNQKANESIDIWI